MPMYQHIRLTIRARGLQRMAMLLSIRLLVSARVVKQIMFHVPAAWPIAVAAPILPPMVSGLAARVHLTIGRTMATVTVVMSILLGTFLQAAAVTASNRVYRSRGVIRSRGVMACRR